MADSVVGYFVALLKTSVTNFVGSAAAITHVCRAGIILPLAFCSATAHVPDDCRKSNMAAGPAARFEPVTFPV